MGGARRAGVCKLKFPEPIGSRRFRGAVKEFVALLQLFTGWLYYSPLALLAQVFPASVSEERAVV